MRPRGDFTHCSSADQNALLLVDGKTLYEYGWCLHADQAMRALCGQADALVSAVDADGDGAIDFGEFTQQFART